MLRRFPHSKASRKPRSTGALQRGHLVIEGGSRKCGRSSLSKSKPRIEASSSGESGAELIEDEELSGSLEVDGREDAVIDDDMSCWFDWSSLFVVFSNRFLRLFVYGPLPAVKSSGFLNEVFDLVFRGLMLFGIIGGTLNFRGVAFRDGTCGGILKPFSTFFCRFVALSDRGVVLV